MQKSLTEYKHVIWDYNGTLIDDTWLCVEILNQSLSGRRMPTVSKDQYRRDFDFPVKDFYRGLGFDFQSTSYEQIAAEFIEQYEKRQFECDLQPGAVAVLTKLAETGFSQSILSAYHQDKLDEAVDYFNLRRFFGHVIGLSDFYAHSKVHTGRGLLRRLSCPVEDVILIGDTTHDYEVARQIGIDCMLIANGHQLRKKLQLRNTVVFDTLKDILPLLY